MSGCTPAVPCVVDSAVPSAVITAYSERQAAGEKNNVEETGAPGVCIGEAAKNDQPPGTESQSPLPFAMGSAGGVAQPWPASVPAGSDQNKAASKDHESPEAKEVNRQAKG